MIKKLVRRYPGSAFCLLVVEFTLAALLFLALCQREREMEAVRLAGEARHTAMFLADLGELSALSRDETMPEGERQMRLYQRARSASELLTETGYGEDVKRGLWETLNGMAGEVLMGEPLDGGALSFLRQFERMGEAAFFPDGLVDTRSHPLAKEENRASLGAYLWAANREEARRAANRLLGLESGLGEWPMAGGGTVLFSCKNAYALMDAAEVYPIEAAAVLPSTGDEGQIFPKEVCRRTAEELVREAYPKKIVRALSFSGEQETADRFEFRFDYGKGGTVTVGIGKTNGRVVFLDAHALREHS